MRILNVPFGAGRACLFACALGVSFGLIGVPAAKAVTFDFQSNLGELGNSHSYTVSGITITAAGFTSNTFGTATHLYGKNGGGDENGLGLHNDPSGDNEITGSNIIRIQIPTNLSSLSFQMGSTTAGETWSVYGSTAPTTGYSLLLSGTNELTTHALLSLCPTCVDFYFKDTGGGWGSNVLLHSLTAVSAVPLPAALPLFATGLGALGLLGWRRKRKAQAAA
jgi:hypothetical protein